MNLEANIRTTLIEWLDDPAMDVHIAHITLPDQSEVSDVYTAFDDNARVSESGFTIYESGVRISFIKGDIPDIAQGTKITVTSNGTRYNHVYRVNKLDPTMNNDPVMNTVIAIQIN